MLDSKKEVVAALKTVLSNTMYELDVETPTLPLITYKTVNDSVNAYGDTLGYSDVLFQIKIWVTKVNELATYQVAVDEKLKELGLKRTYYTELKENNVLIGVFQYSCLVKEDFMED